VQIKVINPKNNTLSKIKIMNLEYILLFYMIPYEVLYREKREWVDMPRNILALINDNHWRKVLQSKVFLVNLSDLVAYYVWSSFNVSKYIEVFSVNDPLWILAHCIDMWSKSLDKINGYEVSNIIGMKNDFEMSWINEEQCKLLFSKVGDQGIKDNELQPIIDVVKEYRCFEDFDSRSSNTKTDNFRKWYHSRTKSGQLHLQSLREKHIRISDNNTNLEETFESVSSDFRHHIHAKLDFFSYMKKINDVDQQILSYKLQGYNLEEIAQMVGYKTHSAVSKRLRNFGHNYIQEIWETDEDYYWYLHHDFLIPEYEDEN
jgi:hypothetical protein